MPTVTGAIDACRNPRLRHASFVQESTAGTASLDDCLTPPRQERRAHRLKCRPEAEGLPRVSLRMKRTQSSRRVQWMGNPAVYAAPPDGALPCSMRAVLPPVRFSSPTQPNLVPISQRRRRKGNGCLSRSRRDDVVKTARERAEEKRAEKLALVREQVESGSLVIRKMTDAERRRYPPRAPKPKRSDKR